MTALLTSKQPVKEMAVLEPERARMPKRRRRRHTVKKRLLIMLVGSLALLCILPMLLIYMLTLKPQITTCGDLLRAADYPQVVHLQTPGQEMAAVQLVDHLAGASQAALVQVAHHMGPPTLDVYIFGCALRQQRPQLTRLFMQQGLVQGAVELTPEHTVITKALDTRLSANLIPFLQPLQQNVYHEYAWQQNSFVQVPFPGFYPVTSRAEANALQQSADDGQNMPWNDPVTTALQMSKDLLQWFPDPQAQVLSRNGDTAVISLTRQSPHVVLVVTLKQLVRHDSAGLWFVTDARTRGMLLTNPGTLNQPLTITQRSPIHFSGASALLDGQTTATLFDHTLAPLSQATDVPLQVHPDSSYSGTLSYANLASGQQGVLLIKSMPKTENFASESGQMLLTGVLLR
jgi:hypothetical protein